MYGRDYKIGKELKLMKNDGSVFKSLRARFYSAIGFLQKGKSLAKKIFFSGIESAEERELLEEYSKKTDSVDEKVAVEQGIKGLEKLEATSEKVYELDLEVIEASKAARRYVDRFNKMKAAERKLQKAEDKYKCQLLERLKDTNGRHVSKSTMYKHDAEIDKCYRRVEEAKANLEKAKRKLERDKKIYKESV